MMADRAAIAPADVAMLDVAPGDLGAVAIFHLHADHVGGLRAMRRRTYAFAAEPLEPHGVSAYVSTSMRHPRADTAVTVGPRMIGPCPGTTAPVDL